VPLTSRIVHPRMMRELRGFHPSYCRIEEATETQDSIGTVVRAWATLTGHDAIPCNLAAGNAAVAAVVEHRKVDTTYVARPLYAQLDGLYTAITEGMRAVIDTVTYDITGVTSNSTRTLTRLALERIE